MILQIIRVSGGSLYPKYRDGDYVFVSALPIWLRGIHPGDVVIYDHPLKGRRIKIVEHLEDEGKALFLVGTTIDSEDSRNFGAVPRNLVKGKVIGLVARK